MKSTAQLDERSLALRRRIVQTLQAGGRGHFASALSLVEIVRVLYDDILKYDAVNPTWADRDRCLLSKGHGCLALYVLLEEKGFFPEAELWKFCKSDGLLGGHPEVQVPGIEASTGSLGHGLSIGIGKAIDQLQKLNNKWTRLKGKISTTITAVARAEAMASFSFGSGWSGIGAKQWGVPMRLVAPWLLLVRL